MVGALEGIARLGPVLSFIQSVLGAFKRPLGLVLLSVLAAGCQTGAVKPGSRTDKAVQAPNASTSGTVDKKGQQAARSDSAPSEAASPKPVLSPRWQLGDRWLWSDGYGLEVVEKMGDRSHLQRTDAEGQWQIRRGLFIEESQSASAHRRVLFRSIDPMGLFPLEKGKRVVFRREYLRNKALKVHNTSWMVLGRETIEVPAGRFDTFVIERRTRNVKTEWTGYEKLWYAPQVRNYVRMEYRYGLAPAGSRVLMAFSLKPSESKK